MTISKTASKLRVLFENKITNYYRLSYKGEFGKVQLEALEHLFEYKESRTQTLADALAIPKQHASKIILRLLELGLVESKKDLYDKRATVYYLSEKGYHLVNEHIKDSNTHFENKLTKLTEEELVEFEESMNKLIKLLEKL